MNASTNTFKPPTTDIGTGAQLALTQPANGEIHLHIHIENDMPQHRSFNVNEKVAYLRENSRIPNSKINVFDIVLFLGLFVILILVLLFVAYSVFPVETAGFADKIGIDLSSLTAGPGPVIDDQGNLIDCNKGKLVTVIDGYPDFVQDGQVVGEVPEAGDLVCKDASFDAILENEVVLSNGKSGKMVTALAEVFCSFSGFTTADGMPDPRCVATNEAVILASLGQYSFVLPEDPLAGVIVPTPTPTIVPTTVPTEDLMEAEEEAVPVPDSGGGQTGQEEREREAPSVPEPTQVPPTPVPPTPLPQVLIAPEVQAVEVKSVTVWELSTIGGHMFYDLKVETLTVKCPSSYQNDLALTDGSLLDISAMEPVWSMFYQAACTAAGGMSVTTADKASEAGWILFNNASGSLPVWVNGFKVNEVEAPLPTDTIKPSELLTLMVNENWWYIESTGLGWDGRDLSRVPLAAGSRTIYVDLSEFSLFYTGKMWIDGVWVQADMVVVKRLDSRMFESYQPWRKAYDLLWLPFSNN